MSIRQSWPVKQLVDLALHSSSQANLWPALAGLMSNSLRILMYHRVCDPDAAEFFGMKANVSATPSGFAAQIDYLSKHYNIISIDDCLSWIYDAEPLPPRAIMITFDDGYRDNLTEATPVLAERKIPFLLFPAVGYLDDQRVFLWDGVAEAFRRSCVRSARLPRLGLRDWSRDGADDKIAQEWIWAVVPLDEISRSMAIEELSEILAYDVLGKPPAGTHLSWGELQEMTRHGCSVGAHTITHPMMVNLPLEMAAYEIQSSKEILENKLGVAVKSFAFPFGRLSDYDPGYASLLIRSGLQIAFRSTGTLNFAKESRRNPYEIRRRCIGRFARLDDFVAVSSGASRLWGR